MKRALVPILACILMASAIVPGCTVLNDPNKPPIAVFSSEPSSINVGEVVFFTANESKDKDGRIVKYTWNFGDGDVALGQFTEHKYDSGGNFEVKLIVTDDEKAVDTANATIHVNEWPNAKGLAEKDPIKINEEVTFDGSSSTDKDGKIVDYIWNFGDSGPETKGKTPIHKFTKVGTYNITLTVKDDHGAQNIDTFTVDVVLRKYKVLWDESSSLIDTISDYTTENETMNKTIEIDMTNLTGLEFNMTWADHIPVVGAANDDFTLEVESPDGDVKRVSTTVELISHLFKIDDVPDTIKHEAESASKVEEFIASQFTSTNGNGIWKLRVTCNDAGDWFLDQFDLDQGNDWDIEVRGYYYTASIIETG